MSHFSNYQQGFKRNAPICIDLFCGCGGLSLGFSQAGGLPIAAVDHDKASMETYRAMFPMCEDAHCGDIEKWHPKLPNRHVDVIIGGPPCQGFSLARGERFLDDPRNHLYKHFVRIVDAIQPSWIVLENVEGITNIGDGIILKQIYEDFEAIGYWLTHKVINMADYGVPQARKRAIFVGSKNVQNFKWPDPTHYFAKKHAFPPIDRLENRSVLDALGDLPWPMGNYFSHRANSQMRGPRNRDVKTDPAFTLRVRGDEFALCEKPATGAFSPGPVPDIDFFYTSPKNDYQEMMRETPPSWITDYAPAPTFNRNIPKLKGTRRLSVRELARLQSFPDWFWFSGEPYAQGKQIGNAVPPLFAKQLFEAIFQQSQEPILKTERALAAAC